MAEGGQGTSQVSAVSVNLNGDRENSAKPVTVSLPMNGGNGTYSYSRNSYHQMHIYHGCMKS
ncbi:hypothetical protein C1H46_041497 [Malus baccata]|uniref:Uncharacterized protein n=1 Tax=Malus baccata TaxID=106549 RepID=A0A540KG78_MALBA|nr:hypothetical protein C1H46_041497 [Malus baccata]